MVVEKFSRLAISSKVATIEQIQSLLEDDSRVFTRESFIDLIRAVFAHSVSLDARALADDMGFQYSSVKRWIVGRAAPHRSLWSTVIVWIQKALEQKRTESLALLA